ncbi:MAG: ABC transporter ATP-binding protein, partial [Oscillospiraceae bacterium]|nr:ABC transporter ATP-binding protein [Oscillospiraceae bacterium]
GKSILQLLCDTCRAKDITVVVITHNMAITPMANKVVKINSGKVESIINNDNPTAISDIEW